MKKIIALLFALLLVGCGSPREAVEEKYPGKLITVIPGGNSHEFVVYDGVDHVVRYIRVDVITNDLENDYILMVIPQKVERDSTR